MLSQSLREWHRKKTKQENCSVESSLDLLQFLSLTNIKIDNTQCFDDVTYIFHYFPLIKANKTKKQMTKQWSERKKRNIQMCVSYLKFCCCKLELRF